MDGDKERDERARELSTEEQQIQQNEYVGLYDWRDKREDKRKKREHMLINCGNIVTTNLLKYLSQIND